MHDTTLLAATFLLCACGSAPDLPLKDTLAETGCDPLVPQQCGLPFPSNAWLVDDSKTPTGHQVRFGAQTLPPLANRPTDPAPWNAADGFSPATAALAYLPGATGAGMPDEDHLDVSVTPQSPTILLNARTGQLVPHLAEIDMSTPADEERAILIHPVVRLDDDTRYIVAIRRVVDRAGAPVPPSDAFRALRDGTPTIEASIERRRALYADIFGRLAAAGVPKDDLQLAWDYSTASRDELTGTLVALRDEALAVVGEEGPTYAITEIIENPNPRVRRRILGTMRVPLYLDQPTPQGKMLFDAGGRPKQNGFADFPFLVQIPNRATRGTPAAILQNGHGLFGSKEEGQNGYMAQLIDEKNFVEIAVDLFGFAEADVPSVSTAISGDLGAFRHVVERQQQGMVNQLLAMRMMKGRFWREPMAQFDGKPAIDPTHCYYRGDSQGGIMGGTYMSLSTDVTRGLLGEPGMPYNLLLNRSVDFTPYFALLQGVTSNAREIQIALGAVQMLWDRVEPSGYTPYLTDNPLPNTPSHNVLLHVAIGDHQVSPLGAHVLARTIKARNVKPVNREIWGVPGADAPFVGNGMAEWDFGLPPAPTSNTPMTAGDDPHDTVRKLPSSIDMTDAFLRTGEVRNTCGGACKGS